MRCPHCDDGYMDLVKRTRKDSGWISDRRGINTKKRIIEIQVYQCGNCGYQETHERQA